MKGHLIKESLRPEILKLCVFLLVRELCESYSLGVRSASIEIFNQHLSID
jgi:hypothetical protein